MIKIKRIPIFRQFIFFLIFTLLFAILNCKENQTSRINSPKTTGNKSLISELPTIPNDINFNQTIAVDFGWQLFVAMNWPASTTARGVPDTSKNIGDTSVPTVWETFKTVDEVFLPNGEKPADWNTYASNLPPECNSLGLEKSGFHQPHFLNQVTKVRSGGSSNSEVSMTNQVAGGSVTDQNGNLVRYSINFNSR